MADKRVLGQLQRAGVASSSVAPYRKEVRPVQDKVRGSEQPETQPIESALG
jgi:hypothetical protein